MIRSMVGDGVDHGAALLQLHTGTVPVQAAEHGRLGALRAGHGESESSGLHHHQAVASDTAAQKNWSSSFLPGEYQGTAIGNSGMKVRRSSRSPIPYLDPQRAAAGTAALRARHAAEHEPAPRRAARDDPELEARIERVRAGVPHADQRRPRHSKSTRNRKQRRSSTVWTTKTARLRLAVPAGAAAGRARRAVRAVLAQLQVGSAQRPVRCHTKNAREVDKPIAGLLKDLKSRGLLEGHAGHLGR